MKDLQQQLQEELNESRHSVRQGDAVGLIQSHLTNAFIEMWDEWGMNLSAQEFNEYIKQATKDFDIRKMLDWGKNIPEK